MSKNTNPEEVAIERLTKLLDVKSVSEEETKIFKESNISHAKLCRAFEYWFDQSKIIFGESVLLNQNQSLRDAGVDLTMNLVTTKINFGFQIKSYGDVREKKFSSKVNAQINQSHRHKLKKIVLAIAGNLTDKTQSERIRGLMSEIQQQSDNYVILVPPEKVVTIYNAYNEKKHPLKFVLFTFSDAIKITDGLSESLSNEKRKVNVNIEIKYKHDVEPSKYKIKSTFQLRLKETDLSFLDDMEKIHLTGETLKLTEDQIKKFEVYENDKLISSFDKGTLAIIPEQIKKKLTIRPLSESDAELGKLESLVFVRKIVGKETHLILNDSNQEALKMEIVFSLPNEITLTTKFEFANSDVVQLQQTIDFVEALKKAKKLHILIPEDGVEGKLDVPDSFTMPEINKIRIQTNNALVTIHNHTGYQYNFPEQLNREELNDIFEVARFLEIGEANIINIKFDLDKESAIKLFKNYKNKELGKSTLLVNYWKKILGQTIKLDSLLELSKFVPTGNIDKLIKLAEKSDKELFNIELVAIDDKPNTTFQLNKN